MPRWASRILLEITGVRVERLQDISQADAIAEGAPPSHPSIDAVSREYGFPDFPRSWFGQTWWHIYGKENWQANPWVWVIEFKQIQG
ncbi:Phage-related protein [Morganella morganii IS15]|nr:Phage-related protein [Morganella morganii IS15]